MHDIPHIHSMLSEHEIILRTHLLEKLIDLNRPLYPNEIASKDCSSLNVASILKKLREKGLLASQEDGAITGVYPLSALPTRHTVQLQNGRSVYAMCAIDALGMAYEFGQDISIASSCRRCGTKISLTSENGDFTKIQPPTAHALHVDIGHYKNWAAEC